MGDYGSKGSVQGQDVFSAIDYLLQFSSSWPLLKVHSSDDYSGAVTHNLGYPPLHFITGSNGQVDQLAGILTGNYAVNTTQLVRSSGSGTPRYYIFPIDLTTNYTAPSVSGSTTISGTSDTYGFKVSKEGKDISSTDLRDFALHSSTRSLMLHKVDESAMVNTGGGLGWETTVSHGLGYTPIAFAYIRPSTNSLSLNSTRYALVNPAVGASDIYYSVSSSSVYITASTASFTGSPRVSVVVLKDPFNKDTINVSYP